MTPAGVAPSILAADFARLGEQVDAVLDAGARTIHVDVMDGHFVPPVSMGALVVDALAEQIHEAGGMVDVHLMVERPERHIDAFAKAGADHITIHAEATPHVHYALQAVRAAGCTAGLALCPGTPVAAASEMVGDLDLLLCMTVNPGWGGQEFLHPRSGSSSGCARFSGRGWRSRSTAGSTSGPRGRARRPGRQPSWPDRRCSERRSGQRLSRDRCRRLPGSG